MNCKFCGCWLPIGNTCRQCRNKDRDWRFGSRIKHKKGIYKGLIYSSITK
jgi:hypothetical protein